MAELRYFIIIRMFLLATLCSLHVKHSTSLTPAIKIYHDVCITTLGECNHKNDFERKFRKRSELPSNMEARMMSGVTAMLTSDHGQAGGGNHQGDKNNSQQSGFRLLDWTNYEHWTESCYLFHALVEEHADYIKQSVHNEHGKHLKLSHIALPQAQPDFSWQCDDNNDDVPGVYSSKVDKKGHKDSITTAPVVSQGYVGLARGAAASLQRALLSHEPTTSSQDSESKASPKMLFCESLRPKKIHSNGSSSQSTKATATAVTCFDTVVEIDPFVTHSVQNNVKLNKEGARSRLFQADVRSVMRLPVEATSNNFNEMRPITLITRKDGPEWTNVDYVVKGFTRAINIANTFNAQNRTNVPKYTFKYAGHAEDFGIHKQCYTLKDQIELWSNSWLVISPHGAHESNVLFMHPDSDGLIEAFACGHRQNFFEVFANYSSIPYHFAQEQDNRDRVHCDTKLGRKYLKVPRPIGFNHDTMLQVLYERLEVPLSLREYPRFEYKPKDGNPSTNTSSKKGNSRRSSVISSSKNKSGAVSTSAISGHTQRPAVKTTKSFLANFKPISNRVSTSDIIMAQRNLS